MVRRRASEQPHAVALRRKTVSAGSGAWAWEDIATSQFRDEVYAVAAGLMAAGIQPGDRVALMSHTRYEWTLLDYALMTAGAVVVPIYETSSAEQAEWILADSAARAVFVETEGFEQMIAEARGRLTALAHVWRIEPAINELTLAGRHVTAADVTERPRGPTASDT